MHQKQRQMSETFRLGALLTVVGGFLDTYTYLSRGGVFANAQTGNIVLLALSLAQGNYEMLLHYLIPILAFAAGVMVTDMVRAHFRPRPAIHWRQIVIALEIAILGLVALLPTGEWDTAANVLVSFVCAVQVQSFRKIRGNPCATTMCTGNLRSGTELLFHAVQDHDPTARRRGLQYYAIILLFILGAFLGVWCTEQWRSRAALVCCLLLLTAFCSMFIRVEEDASAS